MSDTLLRQRLPGLALTLTIAVPAWLLGREYPLVGGPVFGIVLGLLVRQLLMPGVRFAPGIVFGSKQVLKWSVIVLGFGLSLGEVLRVGSESFAVTLVTLLVAFVSAWLLGRLLRVEGRLTLLIGVGTAICGGSAIAAATPIVRASEHETAFSISTIFLFNVIAVLIFPALGHWLQLSDHGFGLWAGTAINDTSSVVAAGYIYSREAGDYATVVKLVRATMIIPVSLILAILVARRDRNANQGTAMGKASLRHIIPWFILGFLAASLVRSSGLIPTVALPWLHDLAVALIVFALTAVGLSADLRKILATGPRPILLGFGVWIAVAVSSLGVQQIIGHW